MVTQIGRASSRPPLISRFIQNRRKALPSAIIVTFALFATGVLSELCIPALIALPYIIKENQTKTKRETLPPIKDPNYNYRNNLNATRKHFRAAYVSGRRAAKNLLLLSALCFPGEEFAFLFTLISIPAYSIFATGKFATVNISGIFKRPNNLINNLARSSSNTDSEIIAEDLVSYQRRGEKIMAKRYLKRLKEVNRPIFDKIIDIMQKSKRGKGLIRGVF
ncbi:MAG: hypothetical protein HQ564_07740 [Candidatus Saganbacteria bacterium]|nr:hypothetical protein [Candidatus Saganbacteria bacterium]